MLRSNKAMFNPEAPAPLIINLISSGYFFINFSAFIIAAVTTIAVPC